MNISELMYILDCDCGDDLPIYAQTERFGEAWLPVIGTLIDENDKTVTFVADIEKDQERIRTSLFTNGVYDSWTDHIDDDPEKIYQYDLLLSFVPDFSGKLYPIEGCFSFAEDDADEESFVLYPCEPAVF